VSLVLQLSVDFREIDTWVGDGVAIGRYYVAFFVPPIVVVGV
jgi:hypothetical protein